MVDLSALPVATQMVQARVEGDALIITAKGSQLEGFRALPNDDWARLVL